MRNHNRLLALYARNRGRGAFDVSAEGNTVYLYDVIVDSIDDEQWLGGVSAERIAQTLAQMSGTVTLRINSPGGSVFGGRSIAQAIRSYSDGVEVIIDGLAASAASFIAIAGTKLSMAPGAMMMIHRAWSIVVGNAPELRVTADIFDKIDDTIAESYANVAGGDKADWLTKMDAETWFTAAEAVAAGLADEALPEQRAAKVSAAWDLSMFDHVPAATSFSADPSAVPAGTGSVDDGQHEQVVEPAAVDDGSEKIAARRRRLVVDTL